MNSSHTSPTTALASAICSNNEGCELYRRGDYNGAMLLFQAGEQSQAQLSQCHLPQCHLPQHKIEVSNRKVATPEANLNDCIMADESSSATGCDDKTVCFDEGMHVFTDVQPLGDLSDGEPPLSYGTVLSVILFNAGQARRRVGALKDALSLYTIARKSFYTAAEEVANSFSASTRGTDVVSAFAPSAQHPIIVLILHNIGQIQYHNGDIEEAIGTFSEALDRAQYIHGKDHLTIAATLNSLGVLYYHSSSDTTGRAMAYFLDALKIQVPQLGPKHPTVATTLNNVGRVHILRDELDDALRCYKEALLIRGEKLGEDSLDYAATALNAGQILDQKGEYDGALHLYHQFLQVIQRKSTKNNSDVVLVLSSIARIYNEKKEFDKALMLYEESLKTGKATFGECHSEVAMLLDEIGKFHFERSNLDAALQAYRDGLRIERQVLEPDHANIIVALRNIGEIHVQKCEWDEAVTVYNEVLQLQRTKLGTEHEDTASTLNTLALIRGHKGDRSQCSQIGQISIPMVQSSCGENNLELTDSLTRIASESPVLGDSSNNVDATAPNKSRVPCELIELESSLLDISSKSVLPPQACNGEKSENTATEDDSLFDEGSEIIYSEGCLEEEVESIAMDTFTHSKLSCGILSTFSFMDESVEQETNYSVVYESLSTRIFCVHNSNKMFGGQTDFVCIKMLTDQFPNPDLITRLENEYNISQHLSNCEATRSALKLFSNDGSYGIHLEWIAGCTLKKWIQSAHKDTTDEPDENFGSIRSSFDYERAVRLAKEISKAIEKIHSFGVVHNKISTENIIIDTSEDGHNFSVKIIDLGMACILEEHDCGTNFSQKDLMSLGEVFFELFSGTAPFQKEHFDSAEVESITEDYKLSNETIQQSTGNKIHALSNDLISFLTFKVPLCISALILNLMEKKEGCHYRTIEEVNKDLSMMLTNSADLLHTVGAENKRCPFSSQMSKIYGRDKHISIIMDAYERVSEAKSSSELVLVSGYSGVGKSTLVQQAQKTIKVLGGNFLCGKYDHFRKMESLSAIMVAFTDFFKDIATNDAEKCHKIGSAIKDIGDSEINVLASFLPCLREIIDVPAAELAQVGAKEVYVRFKFVFQLLVRALCSTSQPLVLFLDDLQWADLLSLDLIETLISDSENKSLLFIGAYRANEVTEIHPLAAQLRSIESKHVPMTTIEVGELGKEDVNEMISDVIQTSPCLTEPLTNAIYRRTSGNALFVLEFLRAIYNEGFLYFSLDSKQWQWDLSSIESKKASTSAVELLLLKIKLFPEETQNALKLLSCLGNYCEGRILSLLAEGDGINDFGCTDLISSLEFAVKEGVVDSTGSNYKFVHDDIQLAAYTLIPENQRELYHLWIGNQVRANEAVLSEKALFIIVGQLNKCMTTISDVSQKIQLAMLNLQAGKKSMSLGAFEAATFYLKTGTGLLGNSPWVEHYTICLELYECYAEAQYCIGEFKEMKSALDEIFSHAKCHDTNKANFILVDALNAQGKTQEALQIGLGTLSALGETITMHSDIKSIMMVELTKTKELLEGKTDAKILALKKMDNAQKIVAMRLMYRLCYTSFFANQALYPLLYMRMVQTTINFGVCNESAFAFAGYGAVLVAVLGDIYAAYRFGELALQLVEASQAEECLSGVYLICYGAIRMYVEPYHTCLEPLEHAYEVGMRHGDIKFAFVAARTYCAILFHCREDLKTTEKKISRYAKKMIEHKQIFFWKNTIPYIQAALNLMGHSDNPVELVGETMDQNLFLKEAIEQKDLFQVATIYYLRSWLAYTFGDYELSSRMAEERKKYIGIRNLATMFVVKSNAVFVEALISLAMFQRTKETKWKKTSHQLMNEIENFAQRSPSYKAKLLLVKAEYAYADGDTETAARVYDNTIKTACGTDIVYDQALAYERAGIFHLEQGNTSVASDYYGQAHELYLKWGAQSKADHLRLHSPF